MEYNTTRKQLVMPEYGRNIQKMILYAISVEDREKRTRVATTIVDIMAQMHPKIRESGDYRQKLWDHLYIISDFKLDVDSPYPAPSKDILYTKPQPLSYSDEKIMFRHYGYNIQNIILKAIAYEDGREKDAFIKTIANHMKKSYLNWNRDSVNDELIYKQLEKLSGGKLELADDVKLNETNDILARNRKKKFHTKGGRDYGQNGKGKYKKRDHK
ncbi:MAG: DUF4290 domain-containing protein [Bacteroidota bacterium]|nr:DUF4290 domain-containing protein [Bacteroidota bacterium]